MFWERRKKIEVVSRVASISDKHLRRLKSPNDFGPWTPKVYLPGANCKLALLNQVVLSNY